MARNRLPRTEPTPVFLIAPHAGDDAARDASLAELEKLLIGLGYRPAGTWHQRRRPDARTLIGAGQQEELLACIEDAEADAPVEIAVDANLTPGQLHHLEKVLDRPVLDRTAVVLRVFESRARTPTAWLEIELARLKWELPRIREMEAARDRTGGGGGRGERGATASELGKQRTRARIAEVQDKLEKLVAADEARRSRRTARSVALVGYTNAGKSSWMRALTGAEVLVEDALFATLGSTIRTLSPPAAPPIHVTDTVGFMRNLHHDLVASFRSTLSEARDAGLLLHVVDAADPEWPTQMQVTRESLAAIGAGHLPELVVFNKADRLDPEQKAALQQAHPEALLLSALDPADVGKLRQAIVAALDADLVGTLLEVPHAQGRFLGEIRERAHVVAQTWTDAGVTLSVRANPADLAAWDELIPRRPAPATVDDLLEITRLHGLELVAAADDFDDTGLDFRVAHAHDLEDRPWILRAPRSERVWETSRHEARVLALVRNRLPAATPDWQVHTREVIAYPRLPGTPAIVVDPVSGPAWKVIDPTSPRETFLQSYAETLAALQTVSVEEARRADVLVRTVDEERERIAKAVQVTSEAMEVPPALLTRWRRWLDDDGAWPRYTAFVHGDLYPGHLLLQRDGRVAGVIDWTEARIGDPVTDLAAARSCFGEQVLRELVERFEKAGGRTWPGLIAHAEELAAVFPAIGMEWGLRVGNEAALTFCRGQIEAAAQA